jgi:hypothetical protein
MILIHSCGEANWFGLFQLRFRQESCVENWWGTERFCTDKTASCVLRATHYYYFSHTSYILHTVHAFQQGRALGFGAASTVAARSSVTTLESEECGAKESAWCPRCISLVWWSNDSKTENAESLDGCWKESSAEFREKIVQKSIISSYTTVHIIWGHFDYCTKWESVYCCLISLKSLPVVSDKPCWVHPFRRSWRLSKRARQFHALLLHSFLVLCGVG